MKGLKPFLSLLVGSLVCAILSGCAGSIPKNPPGALTLAQFTLSDGVVGVPYKQLLVVAGGLPPYTWTISAGSLPPGLTVATDGIISGTPTTVGAFNFTAKVTDSQTPVAAFTSVQETVTINPPLTLPAEALPNGVEGGSYGATITASGGLTPYIYSVAFGNLPDGLTLDPASGTISGTPDTAGVFVFTVEATDAVLEIATNSFTITVVGRLQGNYAFTFNGFDGGQPFYTVGSLVADGNGNITSGVLDQNSAAGVATNVAVTGTYTVPPGSNLGTITLVSSLGSYTYNIVVSSSSDSKFILADATHPLAWGSGLLKKQTQMTFSGIATNFTFGFFGVDPGGNRYTGAGMLAVGALQGSGQPVTAGAEDTNDNGTASGEISITSGEFATANSATGRGTASLTTASGTTNYAYYVVSATESIAMETDTGASASLTLADILQQQTVGISGGTFTNGSLKGQSTMELDGVSVENGVPFPEAGIGVVSFDGAGNIARTDGLPGYVLDRNTGGVQTRLTYNGTYSVDTTCGLVASACGRVTVNLQGVPDSPVWYLVANGQAFVVGTDPDATAGQFLPQSGQPFTMASLLGSYLGGTITPVLSRVTNEVDVAFTPPPGGVFEFNYDTNGPGEPAGGQTNLNLSGAYTLDPTYGAALGRFTVASADGHSQVSVLYIAGTGSAGATGSKTGFVGLNIKTQSGNLDTNPRLASFGR